MREDAACPLCGGEKGTGHTTFTVDLGFGVVVVRRVPARVCTQCGEAWIGNEVALSLQRIVDEARQRRAEVEIVEWSRDAA